MVYGISRNGFLLHMSCLHKSTLWEVLYCVLPVRYCYSSSQQYMYTSDLRRVQILFQFGFESSKGMVFRYYLLVIILCCVSTGETNITWYTLLICSIIYEQNFHQLLSWGPKADLYVLETQLYLSAISLDQRDLLYFKEVHLTVQVQTIQ